MSDYPVFAALARLETKMDAEFAGLQAEMSAFRSGVTDELGIPYFAADFVRRLLRR
jgi:hypothetical protein